MLPCHTLVTLVVRNLRKDPAHDSLREAAYAFLDAPVAPAHPAHILLPQAPRRRQAPRPPYVFFPKMLAPLASPPFFVHRANPPPSTQCPVCRAVDAGAPELFVAKDKGVWRAGSTPLGQYATAHAKEAAFKGTLVYSQAVHPSGKCALLLFEFKGQGARVAPLNLSFCHEVDDGDSPPATPRAMALDAPSSSSETAIEALIAQFEQYRVSNDARVAATMASQRGVNDEMVRVRADVQSMKTVTEAALEQAKATNALMRNLSRHQSQSRRDADRFD
ncbi:hypothetical protein WJX74_007811 [Apatococcus lobatus]|uniref:Uncharacterized protein n=1 Tax=Apatococcus lobatus TaxID=904363 RepID=A0AAW1Q5L0_9CHLO